MPSDLAAHARPPTAGRAGAPRARARSLPIVAEPITPAQTAVDRSAPAPDVTVQHHPYAHFAVYRGAPFERLVADQVAFLGERLPG